MKDLFEIVLMCGNIGSGKSLLTNKFIQNGFFPISRDSIIELSFGGKYEYYDINHGSLIESIRLNIIKDCIKHNRNFIIDETLTTKSERNNIINIIKDNIITNDYYITLYDFGPGVESRNLINRIKHHKNIPISTWKRIFVGFQKQYKKPELIENIDRIIEIDYNKFQYHNYYIDLTEEIKFKQFNDIKRLWYESIYNIITLNIERFNNSIDEINELKQLLLKYNVKYDFMKWK